MTIFKNKHIVCSLHDENGTEIPESVKGKYTGYYAQEIKLWVPKWCECGRDELLFETPTPVTWIAQEDWPLDVTVFKLTLETRVIMFQPFDYLKTPHTVKRSTVFSFTPHFELNVDELVPDLKNDLGNPLPREKRKALRLHG